MTKVSVLYPNKPNARFNTEYYLNVHIPMAITRMGAAIKGVSVDIGTGGAQPGEAPPFAAMCHFICDSPQAFNDAFVPNAEALMGDIPNYTDIEPVIQISEIKLSQ
jgi:uncharacterized protein (TIGR02118 family)